jgi:hypothetical protein
MIRIQMNEKYVIEAPLSGNVDYDPMAASYRNNLLTWGCTSKKQGDLVVMELINGVTLDVTDFQFIMSKDNGDIKYWNPRIKIAEANINDEVPEGLPNRMTAEVWDYTDEENPVLIEPSRPKTWVEWFGVNYPPIIIEGYHYYVSVGGNKGFSLTGSELMIIHNTTGVELVTEMPVIEEVI